MSMALRRRTPQVALLALRHAPWEGAWMTTDMKTGNAGAFFESSERPNLSAASRVLGKDRSSAQRAYRELQARFIEELNRLG